MDKIDMMKRLIVGVDPGVTVGLAALSLDGLPVAVESRRSWSLSDLIKAVSELGEATIVSSDVSPASELLEQLSHKLNAVLFVPLISMGADEKRQAAKAYAETHGFKLNNAHEVDALAAAVKAYQHYGKKFSQVEARVEKQELKLQVDDVKNLVVRGYTLKAAVQTLLDSKKTKTPPMVKKRVPNEERMKNMIEELEGRLARERERSKHQKSANKELQAKIKALMDEIDGLNKKVAEARSAQSAEIRREREYQLLLNEYMKVKAKLSKYAGQLEEYKRRFDEMQRLRHLESQGRLVLLKPIESFTENGLRKAFQLYAVKAGDSVLLLDPSGGGAATAEELARRSVKAVAAHGSMSHQALEVFARYMIPVVSSEDLRIEWIEGFPYADSESLKKAIKEAAKETSQTEVSKAYDEFKTILEDHRKEVTEKK
jgi:predicted RNase H-like nuclease (RuvC/YqgF family)